jgi:hypothetical protein
MTFCLSAGLTVYSGVMFGRLRLAVPDAVLFGDIGQAAFGRLVIALLLYFPSLSSGKAYEQQLLGLKEVGQKFDCV